MLTNEKYATMLKEAYEALPEAEKGYFKTVIDAMVPVIVKTCVEGGDDINIPGLGHFKQKVNKAREGFNPIKKEKIQVPETHTLSFKPVKSIKQVIESKAAAKKSKKK